MKRILLALMLLGCAVPALAWSGYWYLNSAGDLVPLYDLDMGSATITGNITADTLTTLKIKAKSGKRISIGATDTLKVADGGALNSWAGLCADANGSAALTLSDSASGGARQTYALRSYGAAADYGMAITYAAAGTPADLVCRGVRGTSSLSLTTTDNGATFYLYDPNVTGFFNIMGGDTAAAWNFSKYKFWGHAGSKAEIDTVKALKGIAVGGGTMITGIYTGNATGWTLNNTIDTNLVSGTTAASRISLTFRAATATLTAPVCGRTVVDTLFISCVAADTAAVRAGSVDYLIFK